MSRKKLTPQEAADFLGLMKSTLAKWRTRGIGPEYERINGVIRYDLNILEAYCTAKRVRTRDSIEK